MNFKLKGRKILLISPQRWDKLRVSKHHYAITLAALGNEVFFLNPPDSSLKDVVVSDAEVPGIKLVNYNTYFPINLRFRFKKLFRVLMKRQIRRLVAAIGSAPDLVWCFDPNLYPDLGFFEADVRIFHPVDVFRHSEALRVASSAHVLFSVSPTILDHFRSTGKPSFFINHGLGDIFARKAAEPETCGTKYSEICYVGNLLIPYMNRELLRELITQFPEKNFHFIGPYAASSLGNGDETAMDFINFLRSCPNVVLHGPMGVTQMCDVMDSMDAFMLCYTGSKEGYDLSNSHKILEYLSTGKPVISTPITAYKSFRHLISMPEDDLPEQEYGNFFVSSLRELEKLATPQLSRDRKELALDNTYMKQVSRINDILIRLQLI